MKIAIATDQDRVAQGFGCCPFVTIATVESRRIVDAVLIPNPGAGHAYWADLFQRNAVRVVVSGSMGPTARATLAGRGLTLVLGASGSIDDAVSRLPETVGAAPQPIPAAGCAHACACGEGH